MQKIKLLILKQKTGQENKKMINEKVKMTDKIAFGVGKGLRDVFATEGKMIGELFGPDGVLKERREVKNIVTTLGHKMAADQWLAAPSVATPGWMEVGTGTGQGSGHSTLAIYIAGSRTALDSKTRGANAIVTMICTMGAGVGTGAITEAGLFNVVTENTTDMILVASFAAVNKGADDSFVITWTATTA